jgi:hypothetical protein
VKITISNRLKSHVYFCNVKQPNEVATIRGETKVKCKVMNINEILQTGVNLTVSVGINELREWHREVIADTRRELEEVVLSDKAETYPTPKQVSEILNVDLVTLWRWNKKGYLKHLEFGGGRRYKMSDVKAILNGGR